MNLKLIISYKNSTVRLINVDAKNLENSLERDLDTWTCANIGDNLRYTYWKNENRNSENPYAYNRVNIHYNNKSTKQRNTISYYCITEVIIMNEMNFDEFDSTQIK